MLSSWLLQLLLSAYAAVTSLLTPSLRESRLAERVLQNYPLIDLHVDLPVIYRIAHRDDVSHVDYNGPLEAHVDLKRLKQGGSGGFFSIAYVPCYDVGAGLVEDPNTTFTRPNNMVRDTLEQIDVTRQLVAQYPNSVALAASAEDVRRNFKSGRISHLIGIEGAHSLGNSLAALRMYFDLGVRYLTLTHTCNNPFADTSGSTDGVAAEPLHHGLSKVGERLVHEMNRLGMMVDLSHTSDDTARQALAVSKAPVIFSHSGARAVHNHTRNLPDCILELIKEKGKHDSVVGVPVLPLFVGDEPTVDMIADHVEHIARVAGRSRVGIGSDFDGFGETPIKGMEDVTHYRSLLTILARRGWSEKDLAGLTGGNFLRVFGKIQLVAEEMKHAGRRADTIPWAGRPDLKGGRSW